MVKKDAVINFPAALFNLRIAHLVYSVTSSSPEENVRRISTSLTIGRMSDPVDVRTTAVRAQLSEP